MKVIFDRHVTQFPLPCHSGERRALPAGNCQRHDCPAPSIRTPCLACCKALVRSGFIYSFTDLRSSESAFAEPLHGSM